MKWVEPPAGELSLLRSDPLLWEQELDVRPDVAGDLERALGRRSGESFWRSGHDHLYSLELADLGRGRPSMARVYGWWHRFEPRPPEHEIDADLADLGLWVAEVAESLDVDDVSQVFSYAGTPGGWPEGSVLRTPEERFSNLPGFHWERREVEVEGLSMAYVEAGSEDAEECFLLLHGEPTWSYLYRFMIPVLAQAGRVVAPDLIGFGRSDKPTLSSAYTYRSHLRWLRRFVAALDLGDLTLVCQDWGGLLGLRLVADEAHRFRRLVAMNTGLPDGSGPVAEAFTAWRRFSQSVPEMDVPRMMQSAVRRPDFSTAEAQAYGAPFPDREYQTGARIFPRLVPTRPDHPGAYENSMARLALRELGIPVLPIWSEEDPITAAWVKDVERLFPNSSAAVAIAGAGHFIQEDAGEEIASLIVDWMGRLA